MMATRPTDGQEMAPALHRVGAELGAHGPLLLDLQRRRQRAGAEQERQLVGALRP